MEFAKYCQEAHAQAVKSGWWPEGEKKSELEIMALIHSEISEAVEECRHGRPPVYFIEVTSEGGEGYKYGCKPEGELVELADACIRIFDWLGSTNPENIESEYKAYRAGKEKRYFPDYSISIEFYGYLHINIGNIEIGFMVGQIEEWCIARGWDLQEAIDKKMEYNRTRPHRHGGKLH